MYNPETGIIELAFTDQPYEVALLIGYKQDCNYCGIDFVTKPTHVYFNYNPIGGLSVDITWDRPILSRFLGDSSEENIHLAIVGPNPRTRLLEAAILEPVEITYTEMAFGGLEAKYHCTRLIHSDTRLINRIESAYRRNFLSSYEQSMPLYSFDKLPEFTVTPCARNCDGGVMEKLKKAILKGIGVNHMVKDIPVIIRCIINDPAVVVFWSDGTKTCRQMYEWR